MVGLQRKVLFACGAFGKVLTNRFEHIPTRRDFEKRIPRDCHVAINPFPIVQLDNCLTGDELALRLDDSPLSRRWIYRSPQFINLITSYHDQEATAENKLFVDEGFWERSSATLFFVRFFCGFFDLFN